MQKTWTPWYTRPWVARLAIVGGMICLLWAVAGCGRGGSVAGPTVEPAAAVETEPEPEWRQDRSDLLNYFLGHGRETRPLYSRQAGHSINLTWEGGRQSGRLEWVKWAGAHETFRWDAVGVYLVEDQSAPRPYAFSNGMWFPRQGRAGQRGRNTRNMLTWFDKACATTGIQPFAFEWEIRELTPDALVVAYIWGPGREEVNTYTWADGWVRWRYVENGRTVYDFQFDQPGTVSMAGVTCSQ